MKHHSAPWSRSLIVISTLTTLLCLGISATLFWNVRGAPTWAALLPLAIVVGAAPFAIRGYTICSDAILVHRLFWTTRWPLAGLQSVRSEPDVMRGSIRLMGNGGLFSFTGFHRNRALGTYRAFVTDLHRTVVLVYPSRPVVFSPSSPEEFVRDLGGPKAGTQRRGGTRPGEG